MLEKRDTVQRICVIMPAYKAAHYLVESLPPLIALRDQGVIAEVIVVDDCSQDETTAQTATELGATVKVLNKNAGPGAARNLAASMTSCDLLWFVDADVVVHPESAHRIALAFEDERVHALFGSYDDNPPAPGFASQYKNLVHSYYHSRAERIASTFWSGCGVVRREQFLDLNGFDTGLFDKPSVEDIELGYRLRGAGGLIVLDRDFLCTHLKAWSLKEVVLTDILKRAAPWSKLLATRPEAAGNLNVASEERFRAGIAGLWALSALLLPASLVWPWAFHIFYILSTIVVLVNWEFLTYFVKRRGLLFGISALLFHQVYYIYSAVTFSLVTFRHKITANQTGISTAQAHRS